MTEPRAAPEALLAETGWLRRLTGELVRDPHAADDLAQETVLAALTARRPVRAGTRTWLEGIARKLAAYRFRSEHRRRNREREVARREPEPSAAEVSAKFAMHGSVVQAVMSLDEATRVALLMRFWEELPPREIARRLDVPVETVRTRIKRGLARMRGTLDAEHGERRAWALPLLVLWSPDKIAPVASSALLFGVAWMSTNFKVAAVAGVLAVLGTVAFFAWDGAPDGPPTGLPTSEGPAAPAGMRAALPTKDLEPAERAPDPVEPEAKRTEVVEAGIHGRVVDLAGSGIADVAVCLAPTALFDGYASRDYDRLDLEPDELLSNRTCDFLGMISVNHLLEEADVFRHLGNEFTHAHGTLAFARTEEISSKS